MIAKPGRQAVATLVIPSGWDICGPQHIGGAASFLAERELNWRRRTPWLASLVVVAVTNACFPLTRGRQSFRL